MSAAAELTRCERCRYVLINGVCPIHGGRQVSDRLPMLAPMPLAKDDPKVLAFTRKRTRRTA